MIEETYYIVLDPINLRVQVTKLSDTAIASTVFFN